MTVTNQLFSLCLLGFLGMMVAGFCGHGKLAVASATLTAAVGIVYSIKALDI